MVTLSKRMIMKYILTALLFLGSFGNVSAGSEENSRMPEGMKYGLKDGLKNGLKKGLKDGLKNGEKKDSADRKHKKRHHSEEHQTDPQSEADDLASEYKAGRIDLKSHEHPDRTHRIHREVSTFDPDSIPAE